MAQNFHSSRPGSRPDNWSVPRAQSDPAMRPISHGKILPMEEPGFFARLFRRN